MCAGGINYGASFPPDSGITWVYASGVASLIALIFIFGIFLLLGVPVEILFGSVFNCFFGGSNVRFPLGTPPQCTPS